MQLECICTIDYNTKQLAPFCIVNPKFCLNPRTIAYVYANNDYKNPIIICNCKFDSSVAEGEITVTTKSEIVIFKF